MRQLVSAVMPDAGGLITVTGKQFYHLKSVLRVSAGDMVNVRLPDGTLKASTVCAVHEESIILQVAAEPLVAQKNQGPRLWLFQFACRPAKMDLIVRQACECGVEKIIPVAGEYCQKSSLDSVQKKSGESSRWNRIILEAREQSGSAVDTQVLNAVTVSEACALWQTECVSFAEGAARALCLYEQDKDTVSLHSALQGADKIKLCALAVGAEGGISPDEYKTLCGCGFTGVHFATNILRCETAALYGMAAVQVALMEKDVWQLSE